MRFRRLLHGSLGVLLVAGASVPTACSDGDATRASSSPTPPDSGLVQDRDGSEPSDSGPPSSRLTTIELPTTAAFPTRSCSVTLRWSNGGNKVQVAGEFTDWAKGAFEMSPAPDGTKTLTLEAGPTLAEGALYGYKLIVDGQWKLDPRGQYRKVIDGVMNSALRVPACSVGPELGIRPMQLGKDSARVRVEPRSAHQGSPPRRIYVSLDGAGIDKSGVSVDAASGAVEIALNGLSKGKHTISLRADDQSERQAEPIDLPFWIEDEPFDYRDGILYMLLLDRFANGEKSNDKPVGGPVHYDAEWHGGDLQGALAVLKSDYFEKLGVRTIWLSPLNTQTSRWHTGDGNQIFSAYHGYWPTKAREVEPRFGGEKALVEFVKEAHRRGIRVLLDLINNQVHDEHEYVAAHPDWFRKECQCGDDANGCGWSVRPFDCLFQPYLPDINWTNPGAEKQFIADAVHWISTYNFDGFRVDAVKHVEANSIFNMRAELSRRFEQGGARIYMVGETAVGEFDQGNFFGESFADGFSWIDAYTGPNGLDAQFDFPTRHNMADGLVSASMPLDEVERQLAKAESRYRPNTAHVRFLNGHDNPRIASIAAGDPKLGCRWASGCRDDQLPPLAYSDESVYVKLKRALSALYTISGVPYLYQGDEVGFGGGADPDMRRNMLFGGALAGLEMARPDASGPPTLTARQLDLREHVRKLGAIRTQSHALRRGTRIPIFADADLWVYAYQTGPKDLAVVAVNRSSQAASRTLDGSKLNLSAAAAFDSPLGAGTITRQGTTLNLTVNAGEAAIFLAK